MVAEILRSSGKPARSLVGGMIAYGEYLESVKVPLRGAEEGLFELRQLNRRGKGCLSYIVVSAGEAVVIDPSRAIEVYESLIARAGARLVHTFDTHVHADHLTGGPALSAKLGGDYFVDAGADFELRHRIRALRDGDELRVGNIAIRVLATPGHTPGSVCYLVADRYLLTGDTLFKKSVGRPDLGGKVEAWSQDLFQTLHGRIARLDDSTVVLPAHYADIDEIGADGLVSAQLGDLRRDLPELHMAESASFIEAMKSTTRTPPPQYAEIIDANLGKTEINPERAIEWELGKNQCAAGGGPTVRTQEASVR
jgi:glyoxylase-like metal-dependent hydrolase (beta-lactamase superfamily II)